MNKAPDIVLFNGRFYTGTRDNAEVHAIAISDGKVQALGGTQEMLRLADSSTQTIDLNHRRVIPGLHDSHIHLIRGGLNFNMELRWDGVTKLSDALLMLKEQADRTPPPQWVRVVGGWGEYQFQERRMPTLDELNKVSAEVPIFILHLYDRALLNGAALRAAGFTKQTPDPVGSLIQRDSKGNPTGALIANPNAMLLYSTLAKGPRLDFDDQMNSTRHFMRELNRFGITSVIDAGGGFQNYPDDYEVINALAKLEQLTVRISYNLFTQKPQQERADFARWATMTAPGNGDDFLRVNGAGEMIVFSAADFEDFLVPRPELAPNMEKDLEEVIRLLVELRWPFRLHATYDESITRFLDVFERVNRDIPFDGLRWFFDHAETISDRNIDRVASLNGGIAIQNRMAFQGEYFVDRYGKQAASRTPPIKQMLSASIPVGAGTDATRVSSYNPFLALSWMATGRTVGGLKLYPDQQCLDRAKALDLYTVGSSWFSGDAGKKGTLAVGQFADLAVLSADYFDVADEDVKTIESVLTVVGGKIVFAQSQFAHLDPPIPPHSPSWSPARIYKGYGGRPTFQRTHSSQSRSISEFHTCQHGVSAHQMEEMILKGKQPKLGWNLWGDSGCGCWAF